MAAVASELAACIHCGTHFRPTVSRKEFCCAGCQFVHGLIVGGGLDKFYDLKSGEVAPVKSFVFQPRDYSWLSDLVKHLESEGRQNVVLDLQGISCVGCVWLVERLFLNQPGAISADVNSALGELSLKWVRGQCDVAAFARELQQFGYLLGPHQKDAEPQQSQLLVKRMGICAAFAMNAMLFSLPRYLGMDSGFVFAAFFDRIAFVFATLSVVVGGSYFFARTWNSLRHRVLHIDIPIAMGLGAAYAGSVYAWSVGAMNFAYFDFVSTFTFLMLVGRWTQQVALERNRNRLLRMQTSAPMIRLLDSAEKKNGDTLRAGDRYAMEPGQPLPVRSKLLSPSALLGMDWISGESESQEARIGQMVPSGAILCSGAAVELEAVEAWQDSLLARLLTVNPKSGPEQGDLARFIRGYIIVVLILGALGFAAWWLATGQLLPALQVLTSILVVSCPCAAGVALPVADEVAISRLRKIGLFVREQSLWRRLRDIRKIIFDKTGTLTLETMEIRNPEALDALDEETRGRLLRMVATNAHPVSCCIREALMAMGTEEASSGHVKEIVGFGLEMRDEKGLWRLGRPESNSGGECAFTRDGEALAAFTFSEQVRTDARQEIDALRGKGYDVFILSGDRDYKVAKMAEELGLDQGRCIAGMTPDAKAAWIRQVDHGNTLMIGDGANDSLAFNEAHCTGTPAIDRGLLENKADFYFIGRGLAGVRELLETAVARRSASRNVIAFAILYNLIAVSICLAGKMNPLVAAILMPASSLISLMIVFAGACRR